MNYVIAMFFLVSCMNTRNILLYFARVCAWSNPTIAKQKPTTNNFAAFHNHLPLLTMIWVYLFEFLKTKSWHCSVYCFQSAEHGWDACSSPVLLIQSYLLHHTRECQEWSAFVLLTTQLQQSCKYNRRQISYLLQGFIPAALQRLCSKKNYKESKGSKL